MLVVWRDKGIEIVLVDTILPVLLNNGVLTMIENTHGFQLMLLDINTSKDKSLEQARRRLLKDQRSDEDTRKEWHKVLRLSNKWERQRPVYESKSTFTRMSVDSALTMIEQKIFR